MSYDPTETNLTELISSIERLKAFLRIKYGVSVQDLCLQAPALKPVLEFFTLELDALNAKVYDLEEQIKNMDNKDDDPGYPPYGALF